MFNWSLMMTHISSLYMRIAIEQANLSNPISTAYCVGAVIVKNEIIISTGYSRELPGNTHAEECALKKLSDPLQAKNSTIFTTMEPCSKRLSGNKPCVERIIESKISKVVLGIKEPSKFVKCEGIDILRENGIEVIIIEELEDECLKCNKHLLENHK
ncbi:13613_t:CDS:2 [Racocetra persica]|uniref:13613_t:CDS:1 n=1 Tax=Racocetra persica TaxID=160502 RepID=A0ACA9NKM2_9GLOM|nr:13613_t:CDS:2 [Racocetra persica]